MARYSIEFEFNGSQQQVMKQISDYLFSEGYEFRPNYEGEDLFKKGKGIATGPTFVKFTNLNNAIRIEAWVKYAIVPGVYVGEMGIDGVAGCAVKIPLKNRIRYIEGLIMNHGGKPKQPTIDMRDNQQQYQQPIPPQQPQYQQPIQQPQYQQPQQPIQQPKPQVNQSAPRLFCTKCGTKLDSGAMFCHACGAHIQR